MTQLPVPAAVPLSSPAGRWLVVAAALGSGVAFLDGSVVNVALPAIGDDLGGGFSVLQWVLDGYLLTLSALLLLGGALGDRFGRRRVFLLGLVVFTVASVGCGLAPGGAALILARLAQGIGGALLIPGSLALIDSVIRSDDRGRAIGTWAGLSGVAAALGPFLGGWLVDAASWRWVFLINVPIATAAFWVTAHHVPETKDPSARGRLDVAGAAAATVGLGGIVYGLIEAPVHGWTALTVGATVGGALALTAFPVIELRSANPLMPLAMFRSAQFTGANLVTFTVYTALGGALFLLVLQLQQGLGYSALAAGLAFLPFTVIMLLLSSKVGAWAQRVGPRWLMTFGPVVAGAGLVLLIGVVPGAGYLEAVLPAVVVFGVGMACTVAPLTSAVLASVAPEHVGAASGANNAISRVASLLAVAVLPLVVGLDTSGSGPLGPGFSRAMLISAGLCVLGGAVAAVTIDRGAALTPHVLPGLHQACQTPPPPRPTPPTGAPTAEGSR
ncbi:DHA2 family efflux MFS transporter permease subunit [Actinomycetospora lutea]|uniref:DHA2 family efflux MFS transporter permease subunit n=1 Tax=Actinomycetospora lutea TaxID=663604 RepID=UPI002365D822|nr:DHA2 family efflux MFS transporter permease subunit [Actinomycetospora lutea]MDD7940142.1 DHA2 family efflux MFS transporter permease subunit [Actinomycetospora lutea]